MAVIIQVDFESGAPFGETEPHLVVFFEAVGEACEAFGPGFVGMGGVLGVVIWRSGVREFLEALVDFDTGNDTPSGEEVDEVLAVVGELAGGFVEEDDAVRVVLEAFGGEEDVAIVAAVVVGVGDLKLVEFFVNTTTGLVGSENAFGF